MQTLEIIFPLILTGFIGYLCVRIKWFNKTQIDALSAISFNLLVPLFLFQTTYKADLSANISLNWFLAFYIPVIISFISQFLVARYFNNLASKESSITALAGTFSNTVLVAIPIVYFYLPEEIASLGFVLIAFHSAILFSFTELMAGDKNIRSFFQSFKNPIVIAILSGFSCNLLQLSIPAQLLEPLAKLSMSAIPLALFGLGAAIYFLPVKGNLTHAVTLSLSKLLLLPIVTYVFCQHVFSLSYEQTFIAVLLTASPTGVAAYVMAVRHNTAVNLTAATVVISTLLCAITYIGWLQFLT